MEISGKLRDALIHDIRRMMRHWHTNATGSGYRCELCGNIGMTSQQIITHRHDCSGVANLKGLGVKLDEHNQVQPIPKLVPDGSPVGTV